MALISSKGQAPKAPKMQMGSISLPNHTTSVCNESFRKIVFKTTDKIKLCTSLVTMQC